MNEEAALTLRLYGELNDFLRPDRRQRSFAVPYGAPRSIKDLLESIGVPHPEIGLMLADGRPVDFGHPVARGERISAYPPMSTLALPDHIRLRPPLPARPKFVLDVHLGQLARDLRMLGFDALYSNESADRSLAALADADRLLLTRDRELLKRRRIVHGRYVRATAPSDQLIEILQRYDLVDQIDPFARCLRCNAELEPAGPEQIEAQVPPNARKEHAEFRSCPGCGSIYWAGSHVKAMRNRIEQLKHRLAGER